MATAPAQTDIEGMAIPPLTLPEVTGGHGPLIDALAGDLPAGLTDTQATRTLTGTPTAFAATRADTWTATDRETPPTSLVFTTEVQLPGIGDRTEGVRNAIVAMIQGVDDCAEVTMTHLAGIITLIFNGRLPGTALGNGDFDGLSGLRSLQLVENGLTTLPAGIFNGLSALEQLWVLDNDLTTLPAGIFNGLSRLKELDLSGNMLGPTLPARIFNGLRALTILNLHENELETLPAGLFDGLARLERLRLHGNPGASFAMRVDIERRANGQARARILEAAPVRIEVEWIVYGTPVVSGSSTIPRGQRNSDWFGMPSLPPPDIELRRIRFPDVTRQDIDQRRLTGFRLPFSETPRASLIFSPTALTVDEGAMAHYTVRLNTEPAGSATVTPGVDDGRDLTVTGVPTFTTANWHLDQTVTVSATVDLNGADDTVTVTHMVSGYMPVTTTLLLVTVTDVIHEEPTFGTTTVAPQRYDVNTVIPALTLPEVTRGTGTLAYALAGTFPAGLTFDGTTRTLTGMPTTVGAGR